MPRIERECGDCSMCCKLIGVAELSKPAGQWCSACNIGKGCAIYDERPQSCREFHCMWLRGNLPSDELKPSKCKAVFFTPSTGDEHTIQCHVDVGRQWRGSVIEKTIERMCKGGYHVCIIQGDKRTFIKGDGLPMPKVIQEALP